jgi:hypothetical protein
MRVCALDALVAVDAHCVLCDARMRLVILPTRVVSFDPTNSPWSVHGPWGVFLYADKCNFDCRC